ncbi:MAG TPA: type II toxin-antitoxin system prevent-host-death family antitoxin [Candidatus Eisenbacteria bacterium]|nr:type II toxin-antitoxin system prevent-host-death family antitoxin [Candidatus Eisenbacteria bacterium]
MKEIGAFEAKNKLAYLLDLAEKGEEIIITRHGRQVARLGLSKSPLIMKQHSRRSRMLRGCERGLQSTRQRSRGGLARAAFDCRG